MTTAQTRPRTSRPHRIDARRAARVAAHLMPDRRNYVVFTRADFDGAWVQLFPTHTDDRLRRHSRQGLDELIGLGAVARVDDTSWIVQRADIVRAIAAESLDEDAAR